MLYCTFKLELDLNSYT